MATLETCGRRLEGMMSASFFHARGLDRRWLEHSGRTAIATVASYIVAEMVKVPQAFWAPITAFIVTQSTVGVAWTVSVQSFAGTALGAGFGIVLVKVWGESLTAFGLGVFALGLLCGAIGLEKNAYRYAGVTLAIVMLIPRTGPAWKMGLHRFTAVSIGIAVGLVLTAIWREHGIAQT